MFNQSFDSVYCSWCTYSIVLHSHRAKVEPPIVEIKQTCLGAVTSVDYAKDSASFENKPFEPGANVTNKF